MVYFLVNTNTYGDKKEEEIPLSPFPIANPAVYHFHPVSFVQQMMRMEDSDPNVIYINRKWEKWTGINESSATFSEFKFDMIEGYMCEPYGEETTERGKDKRIPVGTYNIQWHTTSKYNKKKYTKESKYGKKFNLDFPELSKGFICLYNDKVPKSRGILMHGGQDGGWTEGCILPSKTMDVTKNTKNTVLKESVDILYKIFDKIEEKGINNIKIIIKDETD